MAKPAILPTDLRHVRPVQPLQFPSSDPEWDMPQSSRHGLLCDLVAEVLRHALGREHSVGKDNFVYFDATHPQRCLGPDAFVKLNAPRDVFDVWKTWERGTPELCVEILSPSDTTEKLPFLEKLERYRALGTGELVAFDADAPVGSRLRAWDRIEDDLVERVVEGETTPCVTLDVHWVIASGGEDLPAALRLSRDPEGRELLPTGEEAERAARIAAEAATAAAQAEAAVALASRVAAEAATAAAQAEAAVELASRIAAEAAAVDALAEVERLKKLLGGRGDK